MDEQEYRAWTLLNFAMMPTLLAALKRLKVLPVQVETEIYETVLQQFEHSQLGAGEQADVVRRAREIIETMLHSVHPPHDKPS